MQFATTGDPNRSGLPKWPAYEPGGKGYLELGDKIEAGADLCGNTCSTLNGVRHEILTNGAGTD